MPTIAGSHDPIIDRTGDSDQLSPAIVYDAANHTYLLAWQDTREPSGIYAQRWQLPQAEFSATPLSGSTPLTVTFTNQTADQATAVTYLWDFGDGTSGSTLTSPEHTYTERGAYDVTLTASAGSYAQTLRQANYIFVGLPHPTVIDYTYDGLYRLTDANYSTGQRFQYAYDPVGNRTAQTATIASTVVTAYQYDEANRLIDVGGATYTWDDNGNLLSDGAKNYTFDQANRLTTIEDGSSTVTYAYNGDGVRLQQIVNEALTTYAVDLATPLPVVLQSQTDESATRYVYALGTRPLAQYLVDTPEYLLADALGSVRQIIDADGNVTLAESYEPYGSVLASTGTASSIFAYAGEETDTSGLIYLRARYMNPLLGIFLARDPWSGDQMRPGSMNGWNYGLGNPVNLSDPSGRDPMIPEECRGISETDYYELRRCLTYMNDILPETTTIQQVQESTIQIVPVGQGLLMSCLTFKYHLPEIPKPDGVYGLGTLVQHGGQQFLYTANHWGSMSWAAWVGFFDAWGEFLGIMPGHEFVDGLRRGDVDPGNVIMPAPNVLLPQSLATHSLRLPLKYAEFGNPKVVFPGWLHTGGQMVRSVRTVRDEGVQIGVYNSVVLKEEVERNAHMPIIEMYSGVPNNFGDSGGGVWFNGQVIGNIWGLVNWHSKVDSRLFYAAEVPLTYLGQ